ncbi:MAG: D-alanyl-D-alanine carboxypeptidase family protein [Oscillospiraceae bacterium]
MIKRISCFIMSLIIIIPFLNTASFAVQTPTIKSDTAILMDAKTGQILFEKQMDKVKFPASITKLITLYLSTLDTDENDVITIEKSDCLNDPTLAHIALVEGEQVTLKDMQNAAMLMSANDACNVIARHISSSEKFIEQMNAFAKASGATNTNFVNANGLPEPDHYTSAHDMALMTKEALKSPKFCQLFKQTIYEMPENNKKPTRHFACQDEMLKPDSPLFYQGILGGKLGWTDESQNTKVTVAQKNNRTLIAVVMDSKPKGDKYDDTKALFDYGFNEFVEQTISPQTVPTKTVDAMNGVNNVGKYDIFLPSSVKFLVHKVINADDITYIMPNITSIDQSQENSTALKVDVVLPEYAKDVMYCTPISLKLKTTFVPLMATATINPLKNQILWVTIESGKVIGIAFGITFLALIIILVFVLIRKYLIIYRRRKRKRRIAKKKQAQMAKEKAMSSNGRMSPKLPQNQNPISRRNTPIKQPPQTRQNVPNRQPIQNNQPQSSNAKQQSQNNRRNIPRNK